MLLGVRAARQKRGLAQRETAARAGLSVADLTRLERGHAPLSLDIAKRLEKILKLPPNALVPTVVLRGEGYVTAVPQEETFRFRQRDHDASLRPIVDLFCGVGGFSSGFEASGEFEVVAGVDLLGDRLDTFTANHGAANAYGMDIRKLGKARLLEENPKPFAVIGGPPCQGFSSIRPFRNVEQNDQRNNLGEEFCRVVGALRPEWIVFENVVGLVKHEGGAVYKTIMEAFQALGYRTSSKVLNAAYHGLPQRRERLIIVGSLRGKAFDWPEPTHFHDRRSMVGKSPLLHVPELGNLGRAEPAISVMDAIGDLPLVASGKSVSVYADTSPTTRYAELMRNGAERLTMHEATAHSPEMLNIIRHAGHNISCLPKGMVTSGFSSCYSRLAPDNPANTMTVNFVHPASNRCIHPFQDRALTPREGARLQSFPDTFKFIGNRTQVVKQIGNAVPPLLGRLIAEAILDSD